MSESLQPINPFRDEPTGLNPDTEGFFQAFVSDYESGESTQPDQVRKESTTEPTSEQFNLIVSGEEKERFDNELIPCAGIEITRKQERQIQEILNNLNKERQQNGLEAVELGKEINLHKITIGGKTQEQLEEELRQQGNQISPDAQSMLHSKDFTTKERKEQNILIRLSVTDLGFPQGATTDEIFNKAQELGMELCPPETGPQWRLQYQDQPMNEWVRIGMKQITDSGGYLNVFHLARDSGGLWLSDAWAEPAGRWGLSDTFVFRPASLTL
jgi:hypothetical protein